MIEREKVFMEIFYGVEYITPEKAKEYLAKMAPNRQVKPDKVRTMARDMENGTWTVCVAPISFDESGCLIDGQHRLMAIVKSNLPQNMYIARGVPRNAVFDRGSTRSMVDSIKIRGLAGETSVTKGMVSITRNYFWLVYGEYYAQATTEEQVAKFVVHYSDLLREVDQMCRHGYQCVEKVGNNAGVKVGVFSAALAGVDLETLRRFVACVNTGDSPRGLADTPAIRLRDQIRGMSVRGLRNVAAIESYTEQAIYDYINERPRTRRYQKDDVYYYIQIKGKGSRSHEEVSDKQI